MPDCQEPGIQPHILRKPELRQKHVPDPRNQQNMIFRNPEIRRALCPGRVRSTHDPLSHVPGPSWIVCSNQRLCIPTSLGPRKCATCRLLAGYPPATRRLPAVSRCVSRPKNSSPNDSGLARGDFGPCWGQPGANLGPPWS